MTTWLLPCLSLLIGVCWWSLRRLSAGRCRAWTALLVGLLFAIPWLTQDASVLCRVVVTLHGVAGIAPKLVDAATEPGVWRERSMFSWVVYLLNPFTLVYRARLRDLARPRGESVLMAVRGAVEVGAGVVLLVWTSGVAWAEHPFWLEHVVKLAGAYLIVFDGQFVLVTALCRLAGLHCQDFSRHPVAAVTPADFWRRYNREAGRFLHDDVYTQLPMWSERGRAFVTLVINGALHEYLMWLISGRLTGYQMAFFAIQGAAVAATMRWRPRGAWKWVSWAATVVFMAATAVLFIATVNTIVTWWWVDR